MRGFCPELFLWNVPLQEYAILQRLGVFFINFMDGSLQVLLSYGIVQLSDSERDFMDVGGDFPEISQSPQGGICFAEPGHETFKIFHGCLCAIFE